MIKTFGWIARKAILVALAMLIAGPVFAQAKYSFSTRNQKKMIKVITLIQEEGVALPWSVQRQALKFYYWTLPLSDLTRLLLEFRKGLTSNMKRGR